MTRARLAALALVLPLLAPTVLAQIQLGASVQGALPQQRFHDRLDDVGLGAGGQLLYFPGGLPVGFGVEGSFLTYGRTAEALPVRLGEAAATYGELEVANRMGSGHAVLRLGPARGAVRPYVDGLVGFHYLSTTSTLHETVALVGGGGAAVVALGPDAVVLDRTVRNTQQDDWALSYGGGAGLLVRVAEGMDGERPFEAYLDLGARYLLGGDATYAPVEDGTPRPAVESATDVLRPYLGLAVRF